jgi:hypothetical protein
MCLYCAVDPLSHSLVKLSNDVYYTKPADAKLYYDADSIIHHYILELPRENEWKWIFDASGFGFKHLIHVNVGVKLAKLISSSYAHNLTKIQVVNSNMCVNMVYNTISPFLSKKIKDRIEFVN